MRKILVLAACGLLFGCGGDDSASEDTSSTEIASEETPTEEEGGSEETAAEEEGGEIATEEEGGTNTESSGEEGSTTESSEEGGEEGEPTGGEEGAEGEGGEESIFVEEGGEEGTVEETLSAFGGPCGYTPECSPDMEDENGELVDNPDWPGCMGQQCDSKNCSFPACTKFCDTDADCEGAEDGPMGAAWACAVVNVTLTGKEIKECRPGSDFAICVSDSDCAEDETCQVDYMNGDYGSFCLGSVQDGALVGEDCNRDPKNGDVVLCANGMCSGTWCLGLCGSDVDCGENAFFSCRTDYFYSDLNQQFQYCYPRACELEADCDDIDGAYCRALLASDQAVEEKVTYWEHACWPAAEGSVAPGEACTNDDEGPACENGFLCINEVCSTQCTTDAECTWANSACQVIEYTVDGFSFDFPLNVCVTTEGSKTECAAESDCGDGESCSSFQLEVGPFEYVIMGQCETADAASGALGAECDGDNPCQTGLCFTYTDGPNRCTGHCQTSDDCGQTIDADGAVLNGVCSAFQWATVGTGTSNDDIYLALCYYDAGSTTDCGSDYTCETGESCAPVVMASTPDETPVISWTCLDLSESADNAIGEDCESGNDCLSGTCVLPAWGSDPGYCSAYCSETNVCPEAAEGEEAWECNDWILLERDESAMSAVVQRCEMP